MAKVKLGAYAGAARGLGAHLHDIGMNMWRERAHYPGTQPQRDNRVTTVYLPRQRGHNSLPDVTYLLTARWTGAWGYRKNRPNFSTPPGYRTRDLLVVNRACYRCTTESSTDGSIQYTLVVPHSLKQKALSQPHEKPGHLGQKKTIKKTEELFYWCNLKVDVSNYVKQCITCQIFKGQTGLQQPFQELPSVGKPLERVGIDLTGMAAGSQGYRYVLSVVDHCSRYVKFYPLNPNTRKGSLWHKHNM